MEKSFKERAELWLAQYGYTVHSHNPDWTNITFVNWDNAGENYPAISCSCIGGETVTLSDNSLKLFLTLSSGSLQFEHPLIEKYILTMKYYADLCTRYPPF